MASDDAPERKKIKELINRYRLEPSIRDVFVEGRSDAAILKKFVRSQKLKDVSVYEISTVEISAADLATGGQPNAIRGRVLYLAFEFDKNLVDTSRAVTCVADRDYDLVLGRAYACPFLMLVDYCCIEMYAFNATVMDDFLSAIAPNVGKNGKQVLEDLEPSLRRLFLIRATNISLGLNMKWLKSIEGSFALKDGSVRFDEEDFLRRYLNKNSLLSQKEKFIKKLAELALQAAGDGRLFVRGHDFIELLSWYLREQLSGSSPIYGKEVLEKLVLAYIETGQLAREQFFIDLAKRVNVLEV